MDARATYETKKVEAEARLQVTEAKIRTLGIARLVVALAGVGLIIGFVWGGLPSTALVAVFVLLSVFIVLVVVHAKAFDAKARAQAAVRFHERGLARLEGTWRSFPSTGADFLSVEHPFADDLDVFGPSSLFQLLDGTETPFGRDALAGLLAGGAVGTEDAASWQRDLLARQEAVRELAPSVAWREALSVDGAVLRAEAPNPAAFLAWAEGKRAVPVPGFVVFLARFLPFVVLVVGFGAKYVGIPKGSWILVVLVEMAISMKYREGTVETMEAVGSHAGGFARYGALFRIALAEARTAPRLRATMARLSGSKDASRGGSTDVVREMVSLERIVGFVEARRNEVFKLFLGPVLMWDLNFAVLLDRWRARSGAHVRDWFAALGELEAFASLAGFAFDRPDHAWPTPMAEAQLDARGLGHPLIDGRKRVGNDVSLPGPGTALVVTGSNMSGKSTLLRAMGLNTVLAQAGAPVAASAFSMGRVTLATSMRIRDSLDDGVSHFYAELKKLKRVVDLASKPPPLLFLLDEILHGTNSRERVIGARSVILGLVARGALGAASTHDLGIADLAGSRPGAIRNVHFEEQVQDDGTMTFDYALREGTVQSSNALRLMRAIGLDVPLEGSGEAPTSR